MSKKAKQGRSKGKKRQRQQQKRQMGYFIKRRSHVDDSQVMNDEGRRIWFDKAMHASWFMRMFAKDQGAKIVRLLLQPDDILFLTVLPHWLPGNVKPDEYLQAIERTTRDVVRGRGPSRAAVRAFLRQQRGKHDTMEVENHGLV